MPSCRSDQCDQCGGVGTLFRDERGTFPVPPATESPGKASAKDSIPDSRTSERSNQVIIDLDEAQPSGESHLPVVGVPGFPGSILGPSTAACVHDCSSLVLAVWRGSHDPLRVFNWKPCLFGTYALFTGKHMHPPESRGNPEFTCGFN